jgi:RimJ/RimL family protein N-acetyltransferase
LAKQYWGQGYATEAARASLAFGFDVLNLPEIVSFTAHNNERSLKVMERLGMRHNPAEDFAHPSLPPEHSLSGHVLYRLPNSMRPR